MGTTLTLLSISGREATIGHVGDSRAYVIRDESCTQLTSDHSRVGDMLRMKLISAEQAAVHPARSHAHAQPRAATRWCRSTCTASRCDSATPSCCVPTAFGTSSGRDDLVRIVRGGVSSESPRTAIAVVAERLVRTAIERDAADNVTAVVVQVTSDRPLPPEMRRGLFRRRA